MPQSSLRPSVPQSPVTSESSQRTGPQSKPWSGGARGLTSPRRDAVQRAPPQLAATTEQVHRHLISVGLTEPGDCDALGPDGRQAFLFDALSTPRDPSPRGPRPGPPRIPTTSSAPRQAPCRGLHRTFSSMCRPHSKPPPHRPPMQDVTSTQALLPAAIL